MSNNIVSPLFLILPATTSDKISEKIHFLPQLLWLFQLGVTVLAVVSAFKCKNLPQNNLVLSSEPLICGAIYEWVYGATQINYEAVS